jgi:hypothetical protein
MQEEHVFGGTALKYYGRILSPQNLCVEILTSKMMALGGEPLGDD